MKPDAPLDYALFQLSPKHSRCELFVSSDGSTEKLASGLLKPFVAHLKIAEEQIASAAPSVRLEVGRNTNSETWFTKGTLERFVRFVSTPEVLELVNTFDAEMSQLETARRIYSQGAGDQLSGGVGPEATAAEDATKKELLRAIDVRLIAVQQDLSTACARAAAAGFNIDTVSELQMFADRFGAHRLNEACSKLLLLCERRPDLMAQWRSTSEDRAIHSSYGLDMSTDVDDSRSAPPPHQEQPATLQQTNSFPSLSIDHTFSRESSVEQEFIERKEESLSTSEQIDEPSIQVSQPMRRLSVQDRINMFENKQKETTGGKPVLGKFAELKRMSSDVSSSGSTLLRRWSGVSDMSIDLSAEKKDIESPLCILPAALASPSKPSDEKKTSISNEKIVTSHSSSPEIKVIPSLGKVGSIRESKGCNINKLEYNSNLGFVGSDGLKDPMSGMTQSTRSIIRRDEHQEHLEARFRSSLSGQSRGVLGSGDEAKGSENSEVLIDNIEGITSVAEVAGVKDSASLIRFKSRGSKVGGHAKIINQMEDSESRDRSVRQSHMNANLKTLGEESRNSEVDAGSRIREAFASRYKGTGVDSFSAHHEVKADREIEGVETKEESSEKLSSNSAPSVKDSGAQRMKFRKQNSAAEQSKKSQVQRDESSFSAIRGTIFSEETFDSFRTPPQEQAERVRQSKGNQELNDELKMKANELEKLFAEHKLRVPGNQSNSASRSKVSDMQHESTTSLYRAKPAATIGTHVSNSYQSMEPAESSKNTANLNATSPMSTVDNQNHGDTLNKKFSKLSLSEGSRGKFYDKYIQKRDAKLREDWSTNRVEKEARLKSLQDSFERSKSELKIKFLGSEDRQDSVSSARRQTERLRSFNSRLTVKRKQHLDFGNVENEEAFNFLERNDLQEDKALDDTGFVDVVSGGVQAKKLLPSNRSMPSSITRTPAVPISRSATKINSTNLTRRKMQPENPLVQSVPNFSDLRKENTKPSPGASKLTRSQVRIYDRSRNTSEEVAVVKEDKPHRSDEEVLKNFATKPFLKKGSRAGFVTRTSIAKNKAFVTSEQINNGLENDGLVSGPDDFEKTTIKGEEFETLDAEGDKTLDNEESLRQTDKYFDSGSENGDNTVTFSQLDQALGSQLPTVPSSFQPVESMQDWPGEGPVSWKLHIQNSFSYPHDMSDIDASVDSPVGSPASWNSQSLSQVENDAARMRKKWETSQKPMLVANSSNLSRKDTTKGFKRFLKFGRRNRGSESLVDWISATTSEGDDDTEDGRDPSCRSSEDLRKSRMGFSQAQPSDDSFNESEFFSQQVQSSHSSTPALPSNFKLREDHMTGSPIKAPKSSFFSLSSFRSKGSETKPR